LGHIYNSVESLEGSESPDVLIGDNQSNTLSGRRGHDLLIGRGGHNRPVGGDQDKLVGNPRLNSLHQSPDQQADGRSLLCNLVTAIDLPR
jgi:Ca2+-binding RTX toxin-like protein